MGIMAMTGALGMSTIISGETPLTKWSQVTSALYQLRAKQMPAPTTEVTILSRSWVLGFNWLMIRSILIWPSLLSTQAVPRKVIHTRPYSLKSTTHISGRPKKYLITTSAVTDNIIKTSTRTAKNIKLSLVRSKMAANFFTSFILTLLTLVATSNC